MSGKIYRPKNLYTKFSNFWQKFLTNFWHNSENCGNFFNRNKAWLYQFFARNAPTFAKQEPRGYFLALRAAHIWVVNGFFYFKQFGWPNSIFKIWYLLVFLKFFGQNVKTESIVDLIGCLLQKFKIVMGQQSLQGKSIKQAETSRFSVFAHFIVWNSNTTPTFSGFSTWDDMLRTSSLGTSETQILATLEVYSINCLLHFWKSRSEP